MSPCFARSVLFALLLPPGLARAQVPSTDGTAAPKLAANEVPVCPPSASLVLETSATGRAFACLRADGRAHGPYLALHPDGAVAVRGSFEGGERHGAWTTWSADGRKLSEQTWVAGVQLGTWTTWSVTGEVSSAGKAWPLELPADGLPRPTTPEDRRLRWSLDLGAALAGPVVPMDELLLVPTLGHLAAVESTTGELAWLAALDHAPLPGIVAGPWGLALVTTGGEVVTVDAQAGQLRSTRHGRKAVATVGAGDEHIVLFESKGRLVGVVPATGASAWKSADFYGPALPVGVGDRVVAGRGRSLRGLAADDGRQLWEVALDGRAIGLLGGPAGVWVLDDAGAVRFVDARGSVSVTTDLPGATAAGLHEARLQEVGAGVAVIGSRETWWLDAQGVVTGQEERLSQEVAVGPGVQAAVLEGALRVRRPGDLQARVVMGEELPDQRVVVDADRVYVVDLERHLWQVDLARAEAQAASGLQPLEIAELEDIDASEATLEVRQRGGDAVAAFGGPLVDQPLALEAGRGELGGCEQTVVSVDLGGASGPLQPGEAELDVVALGLPEEGWTLEPGWVLDDAEVRLEATWWHRWIPEITGAWAFQASEEQELQLERTLACEAGAVSYRGEVSLDDGMRRWRYHGQILLEPDNTPTPWGAASCLVHVSVGGESHGWWRPMDQPGWVDLSLAAGGAPDELPTPATLEGLLRSGGSLSFMEVGETDPVDVELPEETEVWLEELDGGGLVLVARDSTGTEGRWRVDGLRLDPELAPELQRWVRLRKTVTWPVGERFVPVVRASGCEGEL